MKYKGIAYWWNDLQHKYLAQVGYSIIATAKTESAIKRKITLYNKS